MDLTKPNVPDDAPGAADAPHALAAAPSLPTAVDYLPSPTPTPIAAPTAVPASRPRPPAAYVPFPVDLLPTAAAAIVRAGAASIGCDPAYLALPALAALGAAIGNARHAVVRTGWAEPAIIWAMLVGPSGTAKTPAARIVLGPLHTRHGKLIVANEAAAKEHADAMKRYEAALAVWKRKPQGDPPAEPDAPQFERAIIEDTTIEALAPILKANPRGVLLHRDELAGWIGSLDRYAQNGGGDVARWLSIFNGEAITVDRRTTGTTYVPRPAVSVIGGIQPDRLPTVFTRTLRDSGLLARVLIVHPPARAKRFNADDLDAAALEGWARLQGYLTTLEMAPGDDDRPQPVFIGLAADAKLAFGNWADRLNAVTITKPPEVNAARSKLEAYAVRFALIFTVCDMAARISLDHVRRGCALADWFAAEAERIYDALGDDDRDAAELAAWVERQGGTTRLRDVTASGPRKYRNKPTEAKAVFARLLAAGRGEWRPDPARPGRPSETFVLTGFSGCGNETPHGDRAAGGFVSISTASTAIPPTPDGEGPGGDPK